ncbi:MAG: hypothetical protein WAM04_05465 [Candidatus Sulfotelmatobacter sp.]
MGRATFTTASSLGWAHGPTGATGTAGVVIALAAVEEEATWAPVETVVGARTRAIAEVVDRQ